MKIRLIQQILLKDKLNTFREIYKEFQSNVIPHKGDMIADSLWKDPSEYEVSEVVIDYTDEVCVVRLPFIELNSEDEEEVRKYIVEIAQKHKWKCNTI